MFIIANLIMAMARVLDTGLTIFWFILFIRAVISWVNPDPYNPIVQFLHAFTEPVLRPIRRVLPFTLKMAIDISPIIAFLLVIFLQAFVVQSLLEWAVQLKR
jgi:YggT family protein